MFSDFLSAEMNEPKPYGWFHLLSFGIVIVLCVIIILFRNKISSKKNLIVNKVLLATGITMIALEVYKQILINWKYGGFDSYQWYIFPFQFCSTPMYMMLIAGIIRKGKVYDSIVAYLGTFSLFAGLCVMFMPTTVFTPDIGINIQTMFVHGGMIVVGVLLFTAGKIQLDFHSLLKALSVFIVMVSIALLMNILWHFFGNGSEFNMFFISPWHDCGLPLLQEIQKVVPYIVFLLIYLVGFTACAGVVLSVPMLINKINSKKVSRQL